MNGVPIVPILLAVAASIIFIRKPKMRKSSTYRSGKVK
jgi:hypothetical protein